MSPLFAPAGAQGALLDTQTATAGIAVAAYCSGSTVAASTASRLATVGGTGAGSATTLTIATSASQAIGVLYEVDPTADAIWAAGTWTVRLNVTTAASSTNATWSACWVCRLNSSNVSQATIGSLTGQAVSLATTGVKSMAVTGSTQSPAAGDKVVVLLGFSNASSMTAYTPAFTFNQNIDSPFQPQNSSSPNTVSQAVTTGATW